MQREKSPSKFMSGALPTHKSVLEANGDTAATPAFVLQIPTEGVHVMDTPDAGHEIMICSVPSHYDICVQSFLLDWGTKHRITFVWNRGLRIIIVFWSEASSASALAIVAQSRAVQSPPESASLHWPQKRATGPQRVLRCIHILVNDL